MIISYVFERSNHVKIVPACVCVYRNHVWNNIISRLVSCILRASQSVPSNRKLCNASTNVKYVIKSNRLVKRTNPSKWIRTRINEWNIYLLWRTKGPSSRQNEKSKAVHKQVEIYAWTVQNECNHLIALFMCYRWLMQGCLKEYA